MVKRRSNKSEVPRAPQGGLRIGGRTYRTGQPLPKKYARVHQNGHASRDPAVGIPNTAPNFGRFAIPHVLTFSGLATSIARAYRNPDEAIRQSRSNALAMRRDCSVMECLEARQRGTALLNWHIEPDDPKSLEQRQLADEVTKIIQKTPRFTEYRRNLLEALWYGKYGIEHSYHWNYTSDGKRRIVVGDWLPIHGDKITWRFDDGTGRYDPKQLGIRMLGAYKLDDLIAGNRIVEPTDSGLAYFLEPWERHLIAIHKHMIEDAAYEDPVSAGSIHGVGIRSRIYWTWFQAQQTLAFLMEYLERTGMGIWIYYYPAGNAAAKKEMEDVAAERTDSNNIMIPRTPGDPAMDGYGIDRVEPNAQGAAILQEITHNFFGARMKRYILGQNLTTESAATGLGSGVADLHKETYQSIVHYDAANLEETITTDLVEPLKNYNFPHARLISLRFKIDTESPEAEKKLQAVKGGWDMGLKVKAEDVYDLIGISKPGEDDEVLTNAPQEQAGGAQGIGMDFGAGGAGGQPPDMSKMSNEDLFGPLAKGGGEGADSIIPKDAGDDGAETAKGYGREGSPERYAAAHAPKGGVTIAGIEFEGGEFIPSQVMAKATPEEKAAVAGAKPSLADRVTDPILSAINKVKPLGGKAGSKAADKGETGDEEGGAGQPVAPPQPTKPSPAGDGQQSADPAAQRHEAVVRELSKVQNKDMAGVMRAFHESPEYKKTGTAYSKDVAPETAARMHDWMAQSLQAGGQSPDGGRVVHLGGNRLGYASAAGSVVVQKPNKLGGKWQVSYTTQTKPVSVAAGLDQQPTGEEQPNGEQVPEPTAQGHEEAATPAGAAQEAGLAAVIHHPGAMVSSHQDHPGADALIKSGQPSQLESTETPVVGGTEPGQPQAMPGTQQMLATTDQPPPARPQTVEERIAAQHGHQAKALAAEHKPAQRPATQQPPAIAPKSEPTASPAEHQMAREAAFIATGLTAADIRKMEKQGINHSSKHPKMHNFGHIAETLAAEFPEIFGDQGGDYAAKLWDLIKDQGVDKATKRRRRKAIAQYVRSVVGWVRKRFAKWSGKPIKENTDQ